MGNMDIHGKHTHTRIKHKSHNSMITQKACDPISEWWYHNMKMVICILYQSGGITI